LPIANCQLPFAKFSKILRTWARLLDSMLFFPFQVILSLRLGSPHRRRFAFGVAFDFAIHQWLRAKCQRLVLGYNHRIIDGADADQFMVAVRDYLENFNDDIG
jgi:hypothetical protein